MTELLDFFAKNNIVYSSDMQLSDISSFKIGGTARLICYPEDSVQTAKIVRFCISHNIRYLVFGRCSNVLFSDGGIKSLIIKTDKMEQMSQEDGFFAFGAGVKLSKAAKYTVSCGYAGMECLHGIPGSIGGALYMNAGAYDGEMSRCVFGAEYVDESGKVRIIQKDKLSFGYRYSSFTDRNCVITKVFLMLNKGDKEQSEQRILQLTEMRKAKQPLDLPSAGSVFKRPQGYFAGALIEDCGLKGASVGGAMVSPKHAGFIVNTGGATASDVRTLISQIKDRVKAEFGVELECELKYIED